VAVASSWTPPTRSSSLRILSNSTICRWRRTATFCSPHRPTGARAASVSKGNVEAAKNREMLVFCLGSSVIEMQYDDDASFQPTAVSVQEVV
jgi:hypothetical protein